MEIFSRQICRDELKIVHSDDPDPLRAGLGMVCFPLMKRALANGKNMLWWWMGLAEQAAIVFILDQLRPKIAIEIGTLFGGSLQALSKYSDQVYSIDIDPEVPKVIGNLFANVRYLTGNSDYLLPPLIDDLQQNGAELAFALVDGDHSANGVRKDINHLLRFRPTVPFYILMHDSFNPECRAGIRAADWENNPYVQAVELDFVPGVVNPVPAFRNQLWGGLALAILTPEKRIGRFAITGLAELTFQIASRAVQPTLPQRVIRKGLALPRRAIRSLSKKLRTFVGPYVKGFVARHGYRLVSDYRAYQSETSKCRERLAPFCIGYGADLGFGGDPISDAAVRIDYPNPYTAHTGMYPVQLGGDASRLHWFADGVLDYIYSSHLLEDFQDTKGILIEWLRVLKPGGHLILFCPDQQVYEAYCRTHGKEPNPHHAHADFSLRKVRQILSQIDATEEIHSRDIVDDYSWELVVAKRM